MRFIFSYLRRFIILVLVYRWTGPKFYFSPDAGYINFFVLTRNWLQARLTVYPPQYADQNPVNVKNYFFSIKLLHAHLQYVCNIPTMHLKDTLKALGGVDFTK